MKNIYSNIYSFNKKMLKKTVKSLKQGNIAALPTETVYGLAANAYSKIAINKIYKLGNTSIDLGRLQINLNNVIHKVNSKEKKVLIEMLGKPGKTFSREEMIKISGINNERSIDVMITRLRQKIENDPKNPKYLQTIRGTGYVIWID